MVDRFEQLLMELGTQLGTALHPDKKGACKLRINDQFEVQLESDAHQEKLLLACFICDLPPGKYRENILKDALKANGAFQSNGTLAYSDRNNKLVLFSYLPLVTLTGQKLSDHLTLFVDKVKNWRSGVESGRTAHLAEYGKP